MAALLNALYRTAWTGREALVGRFSISFLSTWGKMFGEWQGSSRLIRPIPRSLHLSDQVSLCVGDLKPRESLPSGTHPGNTQESVPR
jgi:hypothetical protein